MIVQIHLVTFQIQPVIFQIYLAIFQINLVLFLKHQKTYLTFWIRTFQENQEVL